MPLKVRNGSSAWSTASAIKVRNGSGGWSSATNGYVRGPSGWQSFFSSLTSVDFTFNAGQLLNGQPTYPTCNPDFIGYGNYLGAPYGSAPSPSTYRGIAFPYFYTQTNYINDGLGSCALDPDITYSTIWSGDVGNTNQVFNRIEFWNSSYTVLSDTLNWADASSTIGSFAQWDNVIKFAASGTYYLRIYYAP